MQKKIALIILVFTLLGMPLMADEIRLNNGELVTGNIVALNEDTLRIATVSGEIFIPRDKIEAAFLGWETASAHPKESRPVETSLKTPSPVPDLGTMGGDFLEE
jgi:hypothetical protein